MRHHVIGAEQIGVWVGSFRPDELDKVDWAWPLIHTCWRSKECS